MTRQTLWAAAALVALTFLAYTPSLTSPFTHYDDPLYVWGNLDRLKPPGWAGFALQFDGTRAWSGEFVEYFPLRDAVYWGLVQTVGLNSLAFHLTSLVLHLVATLLLWLFFAQLGLERRLAWFGALLFGLHPVHIESVVWIAGLKDPMYTALMLGSLCAYASYRRQPAAWKYALSLLALCAGFLVKSVVVIAPVVMLGMELLIGQRARLSLIAARLAGPFVISGMFFVNIMGVGRANGVILGPHGGSFMSHVVLITWAQAKYLKQALLPTSYRLIYCFEPPTGWLDWRLWVGAAVLVGLGALAWAWRRDPLKLFFLGFYVVAMLPVSNLVPFPAIMADRYLYAPTIGTCGLLAVYAARLTPRSFRLVSLVTALMLCVGTASRAWIWQEEEALWEEPDEDPACVVDSAYPAAQSHILRFLTTRDRREGLMALERAMVTPGLKGVGHDLLCTVIIGAAREAKDLGEPERALAWAKQATQLCPIHSASWNAVMALNVHKRPALAAGAAIKAYRLERSSETEVLMWLTQLESGHAGAALEVLRLAKARERLVCEKIVLFTDEAPQLGPALAEAVHECEPVLEGAPAGP